MAIYMTVTGTKQGKFKGDGARKGKGMDWIEVFGLTYTVNSPFQLLPPPRSPAVGPPAASGGQQSSKLIVETPWGESTVQFMMAQTTNEVLKTLVFEEMTADKSGKEALARTITVTNATVASIESRLPNAKATNRRSTDGLKKYILTCDKVEVKPGGDKLQWKDAWAS